MSPIVINKVCFYFTIKPKDLQHEYQTNSVILSDMSWKIKTTKRCVATGGNNEEFLDVFLTCSPIDAKDSRVDWACEAYATITLRAVDTQQRLHQKILPKTEFSKEQLSSASMEFISFTELENYLQNKRLVFDVQIRADPRRFDIRPHYSPNVQQIHTKFRFIVAEAADLEQTSTVQWIGCTKFRINLIRADTDVSVYLRHEKGTPNENWAWNVKFDIKLLSFDPLIQPISKQFEKNYYCDVVSWGYRQFTTWENFIDPQKKFVQNGKAIFEINLSVDPPKPLLSFDGKKKTTTVSSALECSICLFSIVDSDPMATICGHLFCGECIERSIGLRQKCPLCNADIRTRDLRPIYF